MSDHVLVTGVHRSGTTWVANVLGRAPGVALVGREPFNPGRAQYKLGGQASTPYAYIGEMDISKARRAFRRVLRGDPRLIGRQGYRQWRYLNPWADPRLVLRDPLAAMSSQWLSSEFGLDVIVVVRHPAAFLASLKRIGWSVPTAAFTSQPRLRDELLTDDTSRLLETATDYSGSAAVVWRCAYEILLRFADRNAWLVVRHEDLSRDPLTAFARQVFDPLQLTFGDEVQQYLRETTAADTVPRRGVVHELHRDSSRLADAWRRSLTAEEVERVRELTEEVASRLYGEEDW